MTEVRVDRRDFLRLAGVSVGVAAATACGAATQAPPAATSAPAEATSAPVAEATAAPASPAAPSDSKYSEAPELAARVAAGELPPVEERLPVEPLVVEPFSELGEYGGDLRRAVQATSSGGLAMYCYEGFTRWDYHTGRLEVTPAVAKSWDVSEDGRTYTFYLRKGMRWSDGEPFTAADVMFWYEEIALNPELSPAFPSWLVVGGEHVVVSAVDDYTVKFEFAVPFGILLDFMCFSGNTNPPFAPKHYLSQFHVNYADADELAAKVEDAGFETWYELFQNKNTWSANPELPTLWPWVPQSAWGMSDSVVCTRNPYYYRVDTAGKQLPYLDRLVVDAAQSTEIIIMKAIAGEIDLQVSHLDFTNYSFFKENEEQGGYRVTEWKGGPIPCVYVNQSYGDDAKRELFQTREFRQALSYALNRDEMNELFWFGLAEPCNPVASPRDPYWMEGYGQNAVAYDVDEANRLLDSIGLDKRDAEGFRLDKTGKRLQLLMENYPSEMGVPAIDIFLQVAGYWQAVGIDAQAKEIERSLWQTRANANESEMPSYDIAKVLWVVDPGWFVPYGGYCYWAPAYAQWQNSGGKSGMEPPAEIKQIIDWYDQMKAEPDEAKRLELGQKILGQHHEQIYVIGTCSIDIDPMIVRNDMVNYLENGISEWRVLRDHLNWPFQVWKRKS